ncbi:16S rRNA methyltransferase [Duganella sp. Leaf126]|uniref:16S rRNA (uracil(1498)-N(3))-methyltransferase n=1 Tax=Duganella sp. Leaf126 TaxID=1736266 RepID=UPI0006F285D6|nr:16S rRNA (uracil(1498)-N(3))-methyltransferase [Duganella sp. Leaf126]KQQ47117.1 16S rRNA methyltransferase [Duganella sp. Leaf126]
MPRFFCPLPLAIGQTVSLPDAVVHHVQVLRLAQGDLITLFNGEGGEYTAALTELARRSASAEVRDHTAREVELPFALTLVQGVPEGSKMDWIVEKAVELGVSAIVPLTARRSVVRLSGERAEKRLAHWQGVVVSASEQCGRNRLATVAPVQDVQRWLAVPAAGSQRILLSPRAQQSLAHWARSTAPCPVDLLVGPEGGYSDEEEAAAMAAGALPLSMGPRVLRTETAGLAAAAMLAAAWGGI